MANDLPALLAQDTAKEVAIFKAHNGRPLVFAARGETCFDGYAEAVVRLPSAGAGMDFVLATVAGHLWGFHAARAIDRASLPYRELAAELDRLARAPKAPLDDAVARIDEQVGLIADGAMDAALPPRLAARLARLSVRLAAVRGPAERSAALADGIALIKQIFEESSRPIDTIRHQAKTVTVGISRPEREITPLLQGALADLGIALTELAEHDRATLTALSTVLIGIEGAVHYRLGAVEADGDAEGEAGPLLTAVAKTGRSQGQASRYDSPAAASGSKRRALRLGRAVLSGGRGGECLLLVPVFDPQSWTPAGLALLHAAVVPQASLQQKTTLLRELSLYEDLFDAFHETAEGGGSFTAFLEAAAPRDLLFRSAGQMLGGGD
jgi:glucosamine--fructose-6-phosphate aminotransferase (isomerizing)